MLVDIGDQALLYDLSRKPDMTKHDMKYFGRICLLLSILSLVLSLGAPGLGWALAAATMFTISLCIRFVRIHQFWLCLGVTFVHLLTLGPLAGNAGSSFGNAPFIGVLLTAAPFVAGVFALATIRVRSRK